jgi:ligand-binding SRPBCC domain-containing protein
MTFTHAIDLPLPIDRVWAMFQDTESMLPKLTPPEQGLIIEKVGPLPQQVGTELVMSVRSPIGRIKWVARIVEVVPPHATITGVEARFVDDQIEGPFKSWRHTHEFEATGDASTRITDHVEYEVGYGPLGYLANPIVVRPALRKMFAYREKVLIVMTRE